jgi:hypothetical protein
VTREEGRIVKMRQQGMMGKEAKYVNNVPKERRDSRVKKYYSACTYPRSTSQGNKRAGRSFANKKI